MEGPDISAISWIAGAVIIVPVMYLAVVSAYLLLITTAAYFFRKKERLDAPPLKFALVLPAHNEEGQIGDLLTDLAALDYPPGKFTVFVIADNCTDATADRARRGGATTLERHDLENRGKGQALDWFLDTQSETLREYDAISIIDADMRVDHAYLRELSATLSWPGCQVAQASNLAAHPEASWRSALGFLGFSVINHVRPAGRDQLGGTAELKGSGMAFRVPILLQYGWPAHSLAEDAEFSKQLLLDGVLVHYNPDARVTSDLAISRTQAEVQQARWEGGKIYILKKYLPVLFRLTLAKPAWRHLDALLDLLVPPQSALVFLLAAVWAVSWLTHPAFTLLLSGCALSVAFCILSGPLLCRAPFKVWLYFAAAPVFVAWKVPMLVRLAIRKSTGVWQRTPRTKSDSERGDT